MSTNLLQGITVLDLTRLLPGPLCTLYLAELGAEVIKIEPPEGDYVRSIPPLAKKNSYAFLQLNQHKKIIRLDLKNPKDQKELSQLVKGAQVVVESFRPGVTKSLGIDFDSLKGINPSLIYCSISGYGQTGPYKDLPGHDINYLAYSGILDQMGEANSAPAFSNFQIADLAGGSLSACVGILAAIIDAQKTGHGHYIDISMLDCVMGLNQIALASYQGRKSDVPRGQDILNGGFPFYGIYETKDKRYMALGALEAKFWKNFCLAIDRPEWVSWHSSSPTKYLEFKVAIGTLFKTRTMNEWDHLLRNKECCASPVLKISETMMDPHVKERGMYQTRSAEDDGDFISYHFPLKID